MCEGCRSDAISWSTESAFVKVTRSPTRIRRVRGLAPVAVIVIVLGSLLVGLIGDSVEQAAIAAITKSV